MAINDRLDELEKILDEIKQNKKSKKFRIPYKGRVSNRKDKEGYN